MRKMQKEGEKPKKSSASNTKVVSKNNKNNTAKIIKIAVYFLFVITLLVSIPFSQSLERALNHANYTFATKVGDYSVHFIDVGQGDCTLIELPDNKLFMIDTGPSTARNNLRKYLSGLNITTIDYLCFTHYDSDHIGNGSMIFDAFEVKNVFIPKVYSQYEVAQNKNTNSSYRVLTSPSWNNLSQAIYNEGCSLFYNSPDINILEEDYRISFWMPTSDWANTSNEYSPFILVDIQGSKYMFTGDAPISQENAFLSQYSDLLNSTDTFDVDVFKLGHHGSDSSNSLALLQAIRPKYAIVSCGANNYGHPASEVLTCLQVVGCQQIKRTDKNGTIVLTTSTATSQIESTTNFNHITDFYLEWKYVLITGFVLLALFSLTFIKKKKM